MMSGMLGARAGSKREFARHRRLPCHRADALIVLSWRRSREAKSTAAKTAHEKEKRQPKYIGNLLKQAKMREVESDRVFERKLQKEREEQDKVRVVCAGNPSLCTLFV